MNDETTLFYGFNFRRIDQIGTKFGKNQRYLFHS